MNTPATRTRLTLDQRLRTLAYIARGDTMSQVAAHLLEDFDVTISESRLYQIKKNNIETIQKIQERLADRQQPMPTRSCARPGWA